MCKAFVFFDKDGTLLNDVPYNVDPALMQLAPGAGDALRELAAHGFRIAIVSNQSGVARGYFPIEALVEVEARLHELFADMGVTLESFLYCPHHPDGPVREYAVRCECRKPAPGMIQNAASQLGADLTRSWMVGDILDDVEAGRRAGCRTILIDNGHENEWCLDDLRRPHHVAPALLAAAHIIRANSEEQKRFLAEVRA